MPSESMSRSISKTSLAGTEEMSTDSDSGSPSITSSSSKNETQPQQQQQQLSPRSCMSVRTQQESLTRTIQATPRAVPEVEDKAAAAAGPATIGFANVQIREYARRMGDNPGCRCGVSLTLEWEVQAEVTVTLDAYEETRPARRDRSEMCLPAEVRMEMMRDAGFSRGEILQYVKKANIARGQRSRTNETLQLAGAQEMAQRLVRGVLNKSVRRKSKQLEKKTLEMHLQKDKENLNSLALQKKTSSGRNWLGRTNSNSSRSNDDSVETSDCDEVSSSEDVGVNAEESEFLSSAKPAVGEALLAVVEVDC